MKAHHSQESHPTRDPARSALHPSATGKDWLAAYRNRVKAR
jgi:hypothetical protein